MNKTILILIMGMVLFSFASANLPHQQNTDLNFSITSNFATNCTLENINTPYGIVTIGQTDTSSGVFNFNVLAGNYSVLGTYTHNIVCTDGTDTTTGQEFRDVTLSGINQNTTLIVSNIFLILLILGVIYVLHHKYKNMNDSETNKKLAESHNGNWARTFMKTMGKNLMRNSFLWYYSLGWLLLIVLKELVYVFNTEEVYNFFLLFLDIYSFGFFLVIVVWIGILINHFRFITDLVSDINWGVSK